MDEQQSAKMQTVRFALYDGAVDVGRVGFGTMAIGGSYGAVEDDVARQILRLALTTPRCLVDTADIYGNAAVEQWIGESNTSSRAGVVATKVGLVRDASSPYGVDIVGRPDYLRAAVIRCTQRLQLESVPLVLLHRVDHRVPVEESIGALAQLVEEGIVGGIGLSEASTDSVRRAHGTFPLTAVQSEYSLWSRDIESSGVLDVLRELDIPLMASSPLGKGFLADGLAWPPNANVRDSRAKLPRFADAFFEKNLRLLPALDEVAQRSGASRAQTALAWVLARWERIMVIPATRRPDRFRENLEAQSVRLTPDDVDFLTQAFLPDHVAGDRYSDMTFVDR